MKNNIKGKNKFRIVYTILSIWWTLAFVIAFLQGYFMSQKIIFILLTIATPFVSWFVFNKLYKQIIKRKKEIRVLVYAFALLHFIPLVLQFGGIRNPGIDTIITGLIGLVLIWSYED